MRTDGALDLLPPRPVCTTWGMTWISSASPAAVALVALVLQLVSAELGAALGRRRAGGADERLRGQAGATQAAVLALMGLLLAFAFSMSVDRYETRRWMVVEESNAIGTTWLRVDALPPPRDAEARALLRRYVGARLAFFTAGEDPAAIAAAVRETERLQRELWALVAGAANEDPTSLPKSLLVETLNTTIDLHSERLAEYEARVPPAVTMLLVGVAAVGLGTVGFTFGLFRGPHRLSSFVLGAVVTAIVYVTLDLDQPRRGLIRVSQQAMMRLGESFEEP